MDQRFYPAWLALRRAQISSSSGLRPQRKRRDRRRHQPGSRQVQKRREDLSADHLHPSHHLCTCSAAADQLLQRLQYTFGNTVGELEQFN